MGAGDPPRDLPHLALEVVVASGGVDKLEIYRRLGVREVWFWIDESLAIYQLVHDRYTRSTSSLVLPTLDGEALATRVRTTHPSQQTEAVRAYREALRAARD